MHFLGQFEGVGSNTEIYFLAFKSHKEFSLSALTAPACIM
jgi:hypothetical protein